MPTLKKIMRKIVRGIKHLIFFVFFLFLQKSLHPQSKVKTLYSGFAFYDKTEGFSTGHEIERRNNKQQINIRYNYEANKNLTAYYGHIFSNKTKRHEIEITPMIGLATDFKKIGNSIGVQGYYYSSANKLFFYTQAYHLNYFKKGANSFFYNWTEAGYDINNKLIIGGTYILNEDAGFLTFSYGPFLYKEVNDRFSFSAYVLSFLKSNQYYLLGVSVNL